MPAVSDLEARPPLGRLVDRLGLSGRTLLVLVPVHVIAFGALYLALLAMMRFEILQAHTTQARILVRQAIGRIHPTVIANRAHEVRPRLDELASAHRALRLDLYDAGGLPVVDGEPVDPGVAAFLARGGDDRFDLVGTAGERAVAGMVRIRALPNCRQCHKVGDTVGVAAVSLGLGGSYRASLRRVRLNLALVIVAWTLAVGLVSVSFRRLTRTIRSSVDAAADTGALPALPHQAVLDPVSRALLETLNVTLERQRERDDGLADRLQHTERLASLGKLAAGLAHEIKNPLAGVQGTLELMHDRSEDDMTRQLCTKMLTELRRVNVTIHSLLTFARPNNLRRVDADVAALLEETVELIRPGLTKREITLAIEVAPTLTTFHLDRTHIRHVLVNLVHNAEEAIGRGGSIVITAAELPEAGLLLAVTDDGPGIAPEDWDRIFEPFLTTKAAGTGLGLAVAKSLVEQHGGRIDVESKPGSGTTFLISLPKPSITTLEES